ncbi:4Fe-4S binding protein [Rhodoferax sp. 4810]|uniref:4Fe-4S binding protein n=1 Tax=Thiospirillum jenense TaxID=1653858 RepID=A0A839HA05_9GAMM|nr:4Fe-4S dicluster domain-containing protein [Thiospirillum jenense]MBB1073389.1 4Fe-4S binding protein [Rhodoferax jenense]MBB1125741.1 4Fe-4S binding protein [Thiospirillum jenense]
MTYASHSHSSPDAIDTPDSIDAVDTDRRQFLHYAAAGVATVALGGGAVLTTLTATAEPRTTPVTSTHRWGMLIDTTKCAAGCDACVTACERENGLNLQQSPTDDAADWADQQSAWIRKVTLRDNLTGQVTQLPLMCQHCAEPPCVDVCPTGASFKRADGIVMVDRHTCIGCRYCMMACPYQARSFVHQPVAQKLTQVPRGKGCVESCNLCVSRRDDDRQTSTACADACAASGQGAIVFGDLNDPNSPLHQALAQVNSRQIRQELNLNTGVRYAGL